MANILLTVGYDGTNYYGWQRQKGQMTIQQRLEEALSSLFEREITVTGASRTDTGVHALGQQATFYADTNIPLHKLPYAINNKLPRDIRVSAAREVADSFHPRFDAIKKRYRYIIDNAPFQNPMLRNYAEFVPYPLDTAKMSQAAATLVGEHDFAAFCASGSTVKSTVRTIYDIQLQQEDNRIILTVCGNGFLYNMVRIIAGTLIYVGCGKISTEEIPGILHGKDRTRAGKTAGAGGLTLMSIFYPLSGSTENHF